MEVLIGVDPHKARRTPPPWRSTSARGGVGRAGGLPGQPRRDHRALERSKRSASCNAAGRSRVRPAASGGPWPRSWPPRARRRWWTYPAQALGEGEKSALDGQRRPQENDRLDATFTALAALRAMSGSPGSIPRTGWGRPRRGPEALLTERREDLVAERPRALKAACTSCCGTSSPTAALPGVSRRRLPQSFCAALVSRPRSGTGTRKLLWPPSWCATCVPSRSEDRISLDQRIREEAEASGTTFTEVFGVGPILAAKKIVGVVGDISRFPSKAHYFASSEPALLPSKPLVARSSGTGFRLRATAASTRSCT
jgi:hypothetical protein